MNCIVHQNAQYTNFCLNKECMQVLCPECIDPHVQMHLVEKTNSQVSSIQQVKQNCIRKVLSALKVLQNQLSVAKIHQNENNFHMNLEEQITQHTQLIASIFESKIRDAIKNMQFIPIKDNKIIDHTDQVIRELSDILNGLNNNEELIENIQRTCQLDLKTMVDNFAKQIEESIENYSYIKIDHQSFQDSLENIISYTQHPLVINQFQIDDQLKKLMETRVQIFESPNKNQLSLNITPINQSPDINQFNKYDKLNIKMSDFFGQKCKNKILPYFKQGDRQLTLVGLKGEIDIIQLKTDFLIPKYHRSIITKLGDIYLLGGVEYFDNSERRGQNIYCYEPINKKLIKVGKLIVPRSSFGILYSQPYIYSISGLTPELSESCERFDITTNKSQLIQDCNYKSQCPILIQHNNKIYKLSHFNGDSKIEIFNNNYWSILDIQLNYRIHQGGTGIQINNQQFIIFGGYDQDGNPSDETFLFTEDNKMEKTHQLKYKGGFSNPQVIIQSNLVYVLQNVEFSFSREIDESRRQLLILFEHGWES